MALLLAGCAAQPDLRTAPASVSAGNATEVRVMGDWTLIPDAADQRRTRGVHLTRHGAALDQFWIVDGLRDGQRLVEASADTRDGPVSSQGQIKPLIEGSLWALGYGGVGWQDMPDARENAWGDIARFNTLNEGGLEYHGALRVRLRGERMDLAIWVAEAKIYAPRTEADAISMLADLQ